MTPEEYLKANDNASNYADKLLDDLYPKALEDIDALLQDTTVRDADLWDELDTDDELVLKDFDKVTEDERDLEWVTGLAGISAAAATQFFIDNRQETLIKPLAYRAQVVGSIMVSRTVLIQAGKRVTDVIAPDKYFAIQAKFMQEFSFLAEMEAAELHGLLMEYGAMLPPDQMVANQIGYVSRMTQYKPGSAQFKAEVAKLVDTNSKTVLKNMNRRAVCAVNTSKQAKDGTKTEMAWILDPSKKHCDYCLANAGVVKTYGDWLAEGMPGAETCAGGDRCGCMLAAV